jgi:hypothetical protein
MPFLHIFEGPKAGFVLRVEGDCFPLGPGTLCEVPHRRPVLRESARIVHTSERYFIASMSDSRPTFVNERPIRSLTALHHGDRIRIQDFAAVFLDSPAPEEAEAWWQACADPVPMLDWMRGRASARKYRLFACACCRRAWHLLPDPRNRQGVEVAERYADDEATGWELADAREALQHDSLKESMVPYYVTHEGPEIQQLAAREAVRDVVRQENGEEDSAELAALCREIFGPFRPVAVDPAWLLWEGGLISGLARAAAAERILPIGTLDGTRLAVLADAAEEAGCTRTELLEHLRGPGPHIRGCWAVDLLAERADPLVERLS